MTDDDLRISKSTIEAFDGVLEPIRPMDSRLLGIYRQRLDSASLKCRFAAYASREIGAVVKELEHGEFIYFDDSSRLRISFLLEAFIVFLRAALDATVSAYAIYFSGKSKVDSINDILGKWPISGIPEEHREFWNAATRAVAADGFTWINALVGKTASMSLRDLALHRTGLFVDTMIDENDRGIIVMALDGESIGRVLPSVNEILSQTLWFVGELANTIRAADRPEGQT